MTDIGLQLAQLNRRLTAIERQARLSSASLDDAALVVRDGAGGLRAIVGQQGDGTTAVNVVNGGPPPTPSTPTAGPALGGIAAGWDGAFTGGAVMPLDWARAEVHASPTPGFTASAATLQATIETAQGGIVYIPATAPQYVRLLARNTSGAASPATDTVGPYAPRPVAGDIGIGEITATLIADGAVTTPKLFANAVTTAKLSAGSVDATALKADAITGKTITGGTINGAEFHSNDGAGGLVDIAAGAVEMTASNNWKIRIDPTIINPAFLIYDGTGAVAGAINGTGDNARPALNISSGQFTDGTITDWRWVTVLGSDGVTNGWTTKRVRYSDLTVNKGAYLDLTATRARIGYNDSATADTSALSVTLGLAQIVEARLLVTPPASNSSGILVNAKPAHTGYLYRAQVDAADRFSVSTAGAVAATGPLTAASATITGAVTGASATVTGNASVGTLTLAGTDAGRGLITSAARTTNLINISTTSVAALTTPSMTFRDGRSYRVNMVGLLSSTTSGTYGMYQIVKGATAGGSVLRGQIRMPLVATTNTHTEFSINLSNTTGADITTALTVTVSVAAGTGQFSGSPPTPSYATVTDMGLASDWPGSPIT